ncbi:MAG: ROK family protein [Candidatus Kerfeldbacteria bacterium]|nr:ROK family protein [Candidatus Kerfeldbacteria bacterium]
MNDLLFDIGGTNMRLAVTRDGRRFGTPIITKSPKEYRAAIATITLLARQLTGSARITAAAGGVPGALSPNKDRLLSSTHLPRWAGKPLVRDLATHLKTTVRLENDADLAGLGEAHYGAGRGYSILAYLTISTGVGGTRIVGGRIDRAAIGLEPGHQIIKFDGPTYPPYHNPYLRGTLEALISGTAIQHRYHRPPRQIRSVTVWKEAAKRLAVGLVNVAYFWSPEAVVLGGSMMKKPGIDVNEVRTQLRHLLSSYRMPKLARAQLGDIGGLYGALELLKQGRRRAA